MKLRATYNHVLIKPDENDEEVRESGIILKSQKHNPVIRGTVLCKGEDVKDTINVGDVVYFRMNAGTTPIEVEEVAYCVLNEQAILVVEEQDVN